MDGDMGGWLARFVHGRRCNGRLELASAFQPIFSPAHRRAVGYEGLIRARDKGAGARKCRRSSCSARCRPGENAHPARPGSAAACTSPTSWTSATRRSWLFLNIDPYVAIEGRNYGSFFAGMLARGRPVAAPRGGRADRVAAPPTRGRPRRRDGVLPRARLASSCSTISAPAIRTSTASGGSIPTS